MWYFTLLALANLIWAGQGSAVKFLATKLGPIAITFVPFWITTLLLIPLLFRHNPKRVKPTPKDWLSFAIAGIGGQVLAQLGMTWGITRSLASNAAILNLLIPVISAVLASLMLHEKLTRLRMVSFGIGLAGVLLMSVEDLRNSAFLDSKMLSGNLLILGGCAGSSFYNVYCKGLMQRFQEVEILIYSYIFASLASIPLLIWVEPFSLHSFAAFDTKAWLAFAFLAIFMYGVSMLLFFYVLQFLDVTLASVSLYLVPVFGVILGATLLGERLSPLAMIGAAVVLAATILIMRFDS
ncbi:MAG: DMT family transporter [Bryobacteraceae bacterium]|jgi:drug/metabolite transporter (DMT)-like permease